MARALVVFSSGHGGWVARDFVGLGVVFVVVLDARADLVVLEEVTLETVVVVVGDTVVLAVLGVLRGLDVVEDVTVILSRSAKTWAERTRSAKIKP